MDMLLWRELTGKRIFFEITYFDGEKIIEGLKYLAFKNNHKKWAFISRHETLISMLLRKGFVYEKWAKNGVVLEKRIMTNNIPEDVVFNFIKSYNEKIFYKFLL